MDASATQVWFAPALALLLGYLAGSIPFGLLIARWGGAGDIRSIGSGNIGATNVLRTGRKGLAALTLLLDALKATAAILLVGAFRPDLMLATAVMAFLGHLYPVWLRFRGGKGVATLAGVAVALHPWSGLVYAAVWIAAMGITRYSSVGGMTAAIALPVAAALFGRFDLVLVYIGFALVVLWKHRVNVDRLLSGTEPRIGRSTPEPIVE